MFRVNGKIQLTRDSQNTGKYMAILVREDVSVKEKVSVEFYYVVRISVDHRDRVRSLLG